jgi:hypothetical protein
MQRLLWASELFSSGAFLYYGSSLLFSKHMEIEFERYGLSQYRRLTGGFQLAGSIGLIAGFFVPHLTSFASLGLAVLMALGVLVRTRVKDPFLQTVPALVLLLLNALIFFGATF